MREPAIEAEQRAIVARAADLEWRMQTAVSRGDYSAAREYEVELSRLWSRFMDLEHDSTHVA